MMNPESRLSAKQGFEDVKNRSKPKSMLRMEQERVEKFLALTGTPHANPAGLQDLKHAVQMIEKENKKKNWLAKKS